MITSKKTPALDLQEGDLVYANFEFGIVIKKGKTLLHKHKFIKIKWKDFYCYSDTYCKKYFSEDNKIVEKIIVKEKNKSK